MGALGNLNFSPGFYIYVGSAFGPGGLRARLSHHLNPPEKKHWHIDYLRQQADIVDIWFTHDPVRREHEWAKEFEALPEIIIPFPGFGASDCKCNSHLFYIHSEPNLMNIYKRLSVRQPDPFEICRMRR